MFNSICKRAIGLASRQAIASGADIVRRSLGVLMLLVTASVMLNLATPGAAAASPGSVSFTASLSDTSIQAGETTILTFEITNAGPAFQAFLGIGTGSFSTSPYILPAGVVVGSSGVTSNTCSLNFAPGQTATAGAVGFRISTFLNLPATCTVSIQITAASAGTYNFGNAISYVGDVPGTDVVGTITIPGPLTVAAVPDPTPTLTFDNEVTTALVGTDFSLAATSTINGPGAGAITYSASDSSVASVAPETGYVAAVGVGEVTITAAQAAAPGVNAEATATMTFTVEPRTPTVTALSVTSGPQIGGTTVVLTGTNLDVITDVYFGANVAPSVQVNSATEIVVTSPAGAEGAVNVTVLTPYGTSASNAGTVFTYDPLSPTPTLTFATPTSASVAYGGALTNAATSTITGGGAGAITYISSDEAVATVNEATGAITTVGVGVATITATQAAVGGVNAEATTTYELTVNAGPMEVSESVSPSSTVAPGESVALTLTITNNTGADWQTGDLAQFDLIIPNSAFQASVGGPTSNNCGGFQAINATNFQRLYGFVVANGASCTVVFHLTATGAPGESSTVQISFKPNNTATPEVHSTQLTVGTPTPTLTFATPTSASVTHGGSLTNAATSTITGGGAGAITYSSSNTNVATVNSTTGAITTVAVGTTTITATQAAATGVNAGATQTYALTVSLGTGSTSSATLSASTVAVGDAVDLTITVSNVSGVDVVAGDGVLLTASLTNGWVSYGLGGAFSNTCGGSLTASSVNGKSLTGIQAPNGATCTVVYRLTATSASATPESIIVSLNPAYTALNLATHTLPLTITPPVPVLTFATPTAASVALGGSLTNAATSTITGGGAITYSSSDTNVATVNSTTGAITTVAVGTATITATQASNPTTNAAASRTYLLTVTAPAPTVTAVAPSSGPVAGGTSVTLTGTNLTSASAVSFGPTNAISFTVDGATQITATAPAGSAGGVNVTVTTPGGTSATSDGSLFTYVSPPTITGLSPASGSTAGGTVVTVTGTNLAGTTGVTVAGVAATAIVNASATQITFTTPTGAVGAQTVSLATPGGTANSPVAFTYIAPPVAGAVSAAIAFNATNAPVTLALSGGTATSLALSVSPVHGVATVSGMTITYSPTTGYVGGDSFSYTATNAGGTSTAATVTLAVSAVPAITTASLPAWTVSKSGYSQTVAVTGGLAPVSLAVTSGSLPSGLTLNSATGVISGTPDSAGATPYGFTVTATDSLGQVASRTLAITINGGVYVNPGVLPNGVRSIPYSQAIEGLGGTGSLSLTLSGGSLPAGLALNSEAGLLVGTPTATGTYSFTLTATDSVGAAGSRAYTLIIEAGLPIVGPVSLTVAQNSIDNPVALVLSGGAATSVTVTTGPAHGSVTVAGTTITYTPTAGYAGPDSFTYVAANAGGASEPATVSVTVSSATITISTTSLSGATVGAAYSATVSAAGGAAPHSYAVTAGTLPTGLTLTTAGVLSGTPTAGGAFTLTVTATDSSTGTGPFSGTRDYSLSVAAPAISVGPEGLPGGRQGVAYSQALTAVGGTTPYAFSVTSGALPAGIELSATGLLSGTPTANGVFAFTATVGDASGGTGPYSAVRSYNLVIATPVAPTVAPVDLAVAYGSGANPVSLSLGGGLATSIAVPSGPAHGSVVISGLAVTYTPAAGYFGPDSFTYTATNDGGTSAPATATVMVGLPAAPGASATSATATYGLAKVIDLSAFVSGAVTSLTVSTAPAHGAVTMSGVTATYTPTAGYYGADSFAYIATGPGGASAPATVGLTVNAPTLAITPEALPSAEQSIAYSQSLSAGGGAAPYSFTVAGGALPPGLSLSSAGLISGAPTEQGTYALTVRAQDSSTGSGPAATTRDYSLTVAVAPPPVAEAVQVSVTIDATDDTNAGITAIDLSAAVSNASGVIIITGPRRGTLTVSGFTVTYTPNPGYYGPDSFIYRAVGLPGSAANQASAGIQGASRSSAGSTPGFSPPATVSITVTSPLLTMSPGATASASVGAAFSQTFAAAGGTAPHHDYRVESGALPAGLTLSADGRLTGTPTAAGTFAFVIAATDSSTGDGPFIASREYSLTVGAPALSLSPGFLSDGLQGASYSPVTFAGQGGTAPYSFGLSAGSLPTGMTLSSDGLLFGTPIQTGHFSFTVRTTDSSTGSGPFSSDQALTLDIGVPAAPTASAGTLASPYNSAGVEIDVAALVSGAYGSVELTTGPAHGSVVRSGTRFTYTPTAGYYGPDSFSYTAVGYGGPSTPAVVSVTVATPAPVTTPKSATTLANASVDIAVTTGDNGPISSIAVTQAPSHGVTAVNGLIVTYTPATNYFGADSFSYTATGEGGTSTPAVVSLTVSPLPVPTSPARAVSVVSGQSVVLDATTGATGGPFTAVTMASSPAVTTAGSLATGTATVSGERITYAAPTGFSGSTSFTYTLSNPFGTSAPITVAVTVNPMPVTAAPITVVVPADGSGSAVLTTGATGGPFQSAAIFSQSPAGSGTVAITQGSGPSGPTFTLTYTAAIHFSGPVTVSYTLTNAFATSAPGTVIFQVQARADPTLDPDVRSLVAAQTDTTIRFAAAQMNNFNQRLESLRGGPGQSDLTGVNFNFGDLIHRGDQSDPFALRDRQLGRQDADVAPWGTRPALPVEAEKGFRPADAGGIGGDNAGGVSLWTGGTIDMGLRRSRAGLSKLNFTTQGVSVGADFSLSDRIVIGGGTGYSSDSTTIGTSGSRSKATSYVGVLYGAYHPSDRTYLEMVVGYGEMAFESKRFVPVNSLLAYGERDGRQTFVSLTAAFEQRSGPLTWTPYGRVAVVSAELDAFTETGGGVGGLTFHRQDIRSVKGVAGLTSDYVTPTRYGLLTPALRLEYAYEFEDAGTYSLGYADWVGGPVFTASADALGRGRLTLGVSADLQRGPLLLGIEYRGGIGSEEATTHQVSAKMSLKF